MGSQTDTTEQLSTQRPEENPPSSVAKETSLKNIQHTIINTAKFNETNAHFSFPPRLKLE